MLTKKDKKKRYNKKAKTSAVHTFDGWGKQSSDAWENAGGSNLGSTISSVASGVQGIAQAGMANDQIADTSKQEADIKDRQNWQSEATDKSSLLAEMSDDVSLNENIRWQSIRGASTGQMIGNTFNGMASGASAGASVGGPWGAVAGAAAGLISGITGIFTGNAKAKRKARELNAKAKRANYAKAQTMVSKAGALDQADDARALAAYAADGGFINPYPSYSPSPVTEFNEGGSHESNPYDGIPQGIAPDGLPNLVEEGEVKYDNYIFSDRIMLSKNDKNKYKYLKGKTYADAAKNIKKDLGVDERPNDPLALLDLDIQLNDLSRLQEEKRAKKGLNGANKMMYASGGWTSVLRAAPALGNVLATAHQMFNKPDYKHANELQNVEETFTPVEAPQLTQKMTFTPFDVNYYGNKLGAQAGATRSAIRQQTASNPYAATAALLAADSNTQSQLGDLYRQAEEYNLAQQEKVQAFNRATDSANAEMNMKAQQLNASMANEAAARKAKRDLYASQLKTAEDTAWSNALSSSLTSTLDNFGAMGKEQMAFGQFAIEAASKGNLTAEQLELLKPYISKSVYKQLKNSREQDTTSTTASTEEVN